ncbi:Probable calcium-binding protein CML25 [Linum grandiflorum]
MSFRALFRRNKSKKSTASENSPPISSSFNGSQSPPRCPADELELVFKKFDVNGDGKISASELGSIMSSLGQKASEEELQKMITEFDADGDGFIDFKEFVELIYDIDGNGSITAEELHKVMGSLGEDCSIAECRKMISGVDNDGDGTIDFEEFKMMMLRL